VAEGSAIYDGPLRTSAVIACPNDARAIPLMHKRLFDVFLSLAVDYEITFVDDGSQDDTDSALTELTTKGDHVLAIEHSRNFGSQNAFVSGVSKAVRLGRTRFSTAAEIDTLLRRRSRKSTAQPLAWAPSFDGDER
jgi:glycosyltransferase involved in cell wall biosynthesis